MLQNPIQGIFKTMNIYTLTFMNREFCLQLIRAPWVKKGGVSLVNKGIHFTLR